MKKIVIIGSSGAGKTTLARKLHRILKIKVYHLDRLFWKRGWQKKCADARIDILQGIMQETQWIIEGSYFYFVDLRLDEADTIIFLDIPLFLCLYRVLKRHYEDRGRPRRDLPLECTDKSGWGCIWRVLTFPFRYRGWLVQKLPLERTGKFDWDYVWRVLTFPFLDRKLLIQKLTCQAGSKQIIWLRSPKEVEAFLAQLSLCSDSTVVPSEATSFPSRTCEQPTLTGLSLSLAKP